MPKLRLTEREIKNLTLPAADRIDYWDSELVGLCLRVRPSGRKSWAVKWRSGFIGLGTWPAINATQAREAARRELARVTLGISGAAAPDAPSGTIQELWAEYTTRASGGERRNRESIGRLHVLPEFKRVPVADITARQIDNIVRSLSDKPRTGTAVKIHLHGAFELARVLGMIPEDKQNPAALVKGYPYKPRTRRLDDSELMKIGTALRNSRFELLHVELITLLLLTGARVGELVSAKWDMIDVKNPAIILHQHKTDGIGIKRLEMGPHGYALLSGLPRRCDYIFYGRAGIGKITEATRPWGIIRKSAGIEHSTIHDLRRTFASVALNYGMSINDVGILLGHREISATGIYAIADIRRRQELIRIAEGFMFRRLYHS